MILEKQKFTLTLGLVSLLCLVGIALATMIGFPTLSLQAIWHTPDSIDADLFFKARLPRVVMAFVVGGALSVSGVSFQCLLRNPLADPYVLGVSGGAALGAVLGLVLGLPYALVIVVAFALSLVSLYIIYQMAARSGALPVHALLLSGVIFNAFSFALILLVNSLSTAGEIQQIFYILVGSVEAVDWFQTGLMSAFVLLGLILILSTSKQMNALIIGEEAALYLGVSVDRLKKIIFVGASLMVGACVSIAGLIGFVGLFVPHMMRLIWGHDFRLLVPVSFLLGGLFLVACDYLVRLLFGAGLLTTQLPVGVVTALIGGPFFFYLLKRQR